MSDPVCPTCRQPNDTEMAFCIFCGGTLKPGSISGRKLTLAGDSCQSCGKSDPLNGKYCVFCGSNIKRPTPQPDAAPGLPDAPLLVTPDSPSQARPVPRRGGGGLSAPLTVAASVLIGVGAGIGAAFAMHKEAPSQPLPQTGLTILSKKPFASVFLAGADNATFILGNTGSDGNFHLPNVADEKYSALLDNDSVKQDIKVENGHALADLREGAAAH